MSAVHESVHSPIDVPDARTSHWADSGDHCLQRVLDVAGLQRRQLGGPIVVATRARAAAAAIRGRVARSSLPSGLVNVFVSQGDSPSLRPIQNNSGLLQDRPAGLRYSGRSLWLGCPHDRHETA
jgi:hypothetical protein